ncbi:MAG: hypothetical protein ABI599_18355 [Flavobacteriales bacterium]
MSVRSLLPVVVLAIGCSLVGVGQNLVPNWSFEDLSACPESPGDVDFALGWSAFRGSPDLFNDCNVNGWYDVPGNAFSYQPASDGQGYVGVVTYSDGQSDAREFIGAQLSQPLVLGVPVYLSMKLAVAAAGWYVLTPRYSASGAGMFFSTQPWVLTSRGPMPNWSALSVQTAPTDTASWLMLSGVFIPDSAYAYVIIGNPFADLMTDTLTVDTAGSLTSAFTLIDEVCVSFTPDCLDGMTIEEMTTRSAMLYPNPFGDALSGWLPVSSRRWTYVVTDVFGRVVATGMVEPDDGHFRVSTETWPEGALVLSLMNGTSRIQPQVVLHLNK